MPIPSQIIARIKENNSADTMLSITDAGLSDMDVELLTALLRAHKSIIILDLSGNNITDAGAMQLATLARLKILNLENNNVNDAGALCLIKCEHLEGLNLTRNNLHPAQSETLLQALAARQNKLEIEVKSNLLGDKEKKFAIKKK